MITKQDLDDLATMANQCLLPVVNFYATQFISGSQTLWDTANTWYAKYSGGIGYGYISYPTLVSPQPPYRFEDNPLANIIAAGAVFNGAGSYTVTVADAGTYDFIGGTGEVLADGSFNYDKTAKAIYLLAGSYTLTGPAGAAVTSVVTKVQGGWMQEINRIRGDAMALVFDYYAYDIPAYTYESALKLNPAAVCSGPWCVGVNDPDTWPLTFSGLQGVLESSILVQQTLRLGVPYTETYFCIFKEVGFNFFSEDAPGGFSITGTMTIAEKTSGQYYSRNFTLNYSIAADGPVSMKVKWPFSGPAGPPPAVGGFTVSATPATAVTWSTIAGNSAGKFWLQAELAYTASNGDSGTVDFTATVAPAGYSFDGTSGPYYSQTYSGLLTFANAISAQTAITAISPTKTPKQIAISEAGATHDSFVMNGNYAQVKWALSDPTVKGVWTAKTLPVPANNCFIDMDMPPYIGATCNAGGNPYIGGGHPIGIAGNQQMDGTAEAPYTTTMRQAAPIVIGIGGDPNQTLVDAVQSVKPGLTARPAKWLVRRDTDFVPFDFGFNSGYELTSYPLNTALADGSLNYYNVSVPPDATAVRIRLLKSGTGKMGWKAGVFQYGDALAETPTILVRQASFPTTGLYDFAKTDNKVDINPDGGGSYLAGILGAGFSFAVYSTSGTDVNYDCLVEIETGTPKRIYFPPIGECFSHVLGLPYPGTGVAGLGSPGIFFDYQPQSGGAGSKPIPQMGYSIFKLRASRLPVNNGNNIATNPGSGYALTVTVGQNILAGGVLTFTPLKLADGVTNLTLTIPADAGDSGDVRLFIPVLAGNELVYQCSEQVFFEAWGNFQPTFFNNVFSSGQFPFDDSYALNTPGPFAFQYALNFGNQFQAGNEGWPQRVTGSLYSFGSVVQFPLFKELLDDLKSLLTLLGGVWPSGNQTGGAGGSGSAGGSPGAGGMGGGSQL